MNSYSVDAGQPMRSEDYTGPGNGSDQPPRHNPNTTAIVGLRVFLVVVSSLFFLLLIALLTRSQYSDWEALSHPWQPLAQPWQLWLNTGLLAVASFTLQRARTLCKRASADHHFEAIKNQLIYSGVATGLFLASQLGLWQQLWSTGYSVAGNPANSFFYLMTGLHGLHLLGGLVAWARLWWRLQTKQPARLRPSVELCAIYWHYLLFVWLLILALFISPPETFAQIAAFCGFTPVQ